MAKRITTNPIIKGFTVAGGAQKTGRKIASAQAQIKQSNKTISRIFANEPSKIRGKNYNTAVDNINKQEVKIRNLKSTAIDKKGKPGQLSDPFKRR